MKRKPTDRKTRLVRAYWSPMTLWSVEIMRTVVARFYTARTMGGTTGKSERPLSMVFLSIVALELAAISASTGPGPLRRMSSIDWFVVAVLAGQIDGVCMSKRTNEVDGYLLAGRSLPRWVVDSP
jgi:hypothetical protein